MAHFAQLNSDNEVINVIVVSNNVLQNLDFPESEERGILFCKSLYGTNTKWKQTSYNNSFRGYFAGIGMTYSESCDKFITIQPFPSWSLDETSGEWIAPTPYPEDGNDYAWNEDIGLWEKLKRADI